MKIFKSVVKEAGGGLVILQEYVNSNQTSELPPSIETASKVLLYLCALGVHEICLCPGRRNAAFVGLLEKASGVKVHSFFEERSAAFFALGRIKRTGLPVAVITTSGTACAELLPATIEAHYSKLALILVTADRPPHYRGSGAPQVIEQIGLFGGYVENSLDITSADLVPKAERAPTRTLHLNVCFDEPVLPDEVPSLTLVPKSPRKPFLGELQAARGKLTEFLASARLPLVIAGELSESQAAAVSPLLHRIGAPIFAEASSHLRSEELLKGLLLKSGNTFVRGLLDKGLFDAVLRVGGVPSPRVWRDLDEKLKAIPVLSLSEVPFVGLGRGECLVCSLSDLSKAFVPPRSFSDLVEQQTIGSSDRAARKRIEDAKLQYPLSEVSMLAGVVELVTERSAVYLGNSLPIREWDIATPVGGKKFSFAVNRGANGIDGQTSTFLGWCKPGAENWAFLGDLTTLYDLSAPWALRHLENASVRIVVINNGGGQIFSRMFGSKLFLNEHQVSFAGWASQWGLEYCKWQGDLRELPKTDRAVIELVPDSEQTAKFWAEI